MSVSEAIAPDAQWRRLSPRMLLIHPVREAGRSLPALLGLLFAGSSSGHGPWWPLAGLAVVVALSMARWYTTRYQITPEQVRLRTGLFRRRTMTAPADRVHSVDVTAHALHRMLGLARVAIGTGTSDRKREGLVLDGLSAADAGGLRTELLHHAGLTRGPGVPVTAAAPEQVIVRLDPSWVRYAPFTLSGAVTGLAILGFGYRLIDQTQSNASREGIVRSAAGHLADTPVWVDVLQLAVGVTIAVAVLSVAGYWLAFWNFTLTRHSGGSLHISRGLITARATSISEHRLRGVELSETLLLRMVGGARLLVVATGLRVDRGAERGGTMLLPPAPVAQAARVIDAVLEDPWASRIPLRPHGMRARRRRLTRAIVPWLLLTVVLAAAAWLGPLPAWIAVLSLVPLALSVPLGADRYAGLGHELTDRYLVTRFGSLIRRKTLLRREGIIGWNLRQSFFQRRAGLLTLTATTAAGKQAYRVSDIDARAALQLADAAVPGLLTEFLIEVRA